MTGRNQTVFVGLSGGVDSSVAAALLKQAGYRVVGVFIRVWRPDFLVCDEAAERLDAMRVAAHLEIPFVTLDARDAYRAEVVEAMVHEYQNGRTPNPDMLCNRAVKFGVFERFRISEGAAYLATGHYARIFGQNDTSLLATGVDETKDQSYFLAQIPKKVLGHTLFPIGGYKKSAVRELAQKFSLPTATKRDSQGICFLGKVDMIDFLSHYIPRTKGAVRTEDGKVIGEHDGALFYTIGQRHGFRITSSTALTQAHYVTRKDIRTNQIVVSERHPVLEVGSTFSLSHLNLLISGELLPRHSYQIVTRYHGARRSVHIVQKNSTCVVRTQSSGEAVSPGQTCVIYDGEVVVGSGIIEYYE